LCIRADPAARAVPARVGRRRLGGGRHRRTRHPSSTGQRPIEEYGEQRRCASSPSHGPSIASPPSRMDLAQLGRQRPGRLAILEYRDVLDVLRPPREEAGPPTARTKPDRPRCPGSMLGMSIAFSGHARCRNSNDFSSGHRAAFRGSVTGGRRHDHSARTEASARDVLRSMQICVLKNASVRDDHRARVPHVARGSTGVSTSRSHPKARNCSDGNWRRDRGGRSSASI